MLKMGIMKQITKDTILKQGDKAYPAIEVDGGIVWVDEVNGFKVGEWNYEIDNTTPVYRFSYDIKQYPGNKIVASTYPLEGVPLIELEDEVKKLIRNDLSERYDTMGNSQYFNEREHSTTFERGYKANPAKYTEKDVMNAYDAGIIGGCNPYYSETEREEYIQQLNILHTIEVDENFKIINYEN